MPLAGQGVSESCNFLAVWDWKDTSAEQGDSLVYPLPTLPQLGMRPPSESEG